MKYTGQQYKQGIVIQRSPEGSAFQEKKIVDAIAGGSVTPSVSGGLKEVVINGGPGPSDPTIELLELYDTDGQLIDLLHTGGDPVSVKYIKHRETDINDIDGNLSLYVGTSLSPVLEDIAPSETAVLVESLLSIQVNDTITFKLAGETKDGTPISKEIKLVFESYVYTAIDDSGEAPVEDLIPQGRADLFAETGAAFTYDVNDSIYFYTVKSNASVDQYVLGMWTEIEALNLGQIEVTIGGEEQELYCYQVGPFLGAGTDTLRLR